MIDYENRNYLCHKHNESFISYSDRCNENLCIQCDIEHNMNHKIIPYKEIFPNITNIKNKIKESKDIIDEFINNIDNIIDILQKIKLNVEIYYKINSNILNNFNIKNRNYEIFSKLNNINNIIDNIIIKDIKDIINEKNITNKFNKIYNLYQKININGIKSESIKIIQGDLKNIGPSNNEKNENIQTDNYKNEINLYIKQKMMENKKYLEKNLLKIIEII